MSDERGRDLSDVLSRWADSAEPVSAAEARSRAEASAGTPGGSSGGASGGAHRRPMVWLAVAAALVAMVAVAALVVTGDDERPEEIRVADPEPTTTTAADTSTTTTRSEGEVVAGVTGVPPEAVVHTAGHELAVVDTTTGETTRVLATFDDPDAPPTDGMPAGFGFYLGPASVDHDGGWVYYETCCEPAVGVVYRVPMAGGEPEFFTYGTDPAVSPDGTRLAVVEMQWLKVVDLVTGEATSFRLADADQPLVVRRPVWSPDGTGLVIERYDDSVQQGRLMLVIFDGAQDVFAAAATVAEADEEGTPMMAAFDDEGRLHVVRQPLTEHMVPTSPARIEVLDLERSEVVEVRTADGPLAAHHRSPDGTAALEVGTDGSMVIRPDGGQPRVVRPDGIVSAAW